MTCKALNARRVGDLYETKMNLNLNKVHPLGPRSVQVLLYIRTGVIGDDETFK